jgi:hypothetical protein
MTMRILPSLLLGAALIGSAAPAVAAQPDNAKGEAKLAKALAGRVAGKPVNCIPQYSITSSETIDGVAILYRVGSTIYVNRPRIGADALDSDDILVSKTQGSQLCSLDTINLVDRSSRIQRSFITLDDFVPYTKPRN